MSCLRNQNTLKTLLFYFNNHRKWNIGLLSLLKWSSRSFSKLEENRVELTMAIYLLHVNTGLKNLKSTQATLWLTYGSHRFVNNKEMKNMVLNQNIWGPNKK